MSETTLDYVTLEAQLRSAGGTLSLAEIHGAMCGLLCSAGREAAGAWLGEQLDLFDGRDDDVGRVAAALESLQASSWLALSDAALAFAPLLPDDDTDLATRAAALGQWCVGFVGGLALGGWRETDGEPDAAEVIEIVRDFAEISRAGLGEEESKDADSAEFSFVELAEYVRVAVLLVFQLLARPQTAAGAVTLH